MWLLLDYFQCGVNPVVVHGGGPQIAAMLKRLEIPTSFVEVSNVYSTLARPMLGAFVDLENMYLQCGSIPLQCGIIAFVYSAVPFLYSAV